MILTGGPAWQEKDKSATEPVLHPASPPVPASEEQATRQQAGPEGQPPDGQAEQDELRLALLAQEKLAMVLYL